MSKTVAILAIGNEILDGRVLDTNSNYLLSELKKNGIACEHVLICSDDMHEIERSLKFLASNARAIIVSGGLGPTTDDRTRSAIAQTLGVELFFDPKEFTKLEDRYRQRGRKLDPSNNQQAFFPMGACVIPNPNGSAPGFCIAWDALNVTVIALPGVPSELKAMFDDWVLPHFIDTLKLGELGQQFGLRVFARAESKLNSLITACNLPEDVYVSYRVQFPEIQLMFSTFNPQLDLKKLVAKISCEIDEAYIVSQGTDESLPERLHQLLIEKGKTLAVAESCTAGFAGYLLTQSPGSSKSFLGGVQCYSNAAKIKLLGVSPETLQHYGAVSHQCAIELARGARTALESDVALAITGIAGPFGGTPDKPVGTFYLAVATETGTQSYKHQFPATRDRLRQYAAFMGIDCVRRHQLSLEALGETNSEK